VAENFLQVRKKFLQSCKRGSDTGRAVTGLPDHASLPAARADHGEAVNDLLSKHGTKPVARNPLGEGAADE
jgi:hypothetical protein